MVRGNLAILPILVVGAAVSVISINGCGGGSGGSQQQPPPPGKINHVVIIFQENRTPDNLFHDPVLISRGADIASSGLNSQNQTVPLTPVSLVTEYDLSHSHSSFLTEWNGGLMNGADKVKVNCPPANPNCAPANAAFQYVHASD